ncbi:hypothetical protein JOB18_034185 [Solea senegalensis]|uniref:Uncharacterized protein n=1 Tax=Solea senegalensis TaxID=28829 RepID=A0AAV6PZS4_SOLSE|nr:hypothetical protein JOB18_034185 [Solea senegalensis]
MLHSTVHLRLKDVKLQGVSSRGRLSTDFSCCPGARDSGWPWEQPAVITLAGRKQPVCGLCSLRAEPRFICCPAEQGFVPVGQNLLPGERDLQDCRENITSSDRKAAFSSSSCLI